MEQKINKFWQRFWVKNNLDDTTTYTESFYFDFTEKSANKLLKLVKDNKKIATTSLYIENDDIAKVNDLSIVTTFKGTPKAVIKTKQVLIMPFKDMTFDLAILEGEDKTFESWKQKHIVFLSEVAKLKNLTFNENSLIVFEIFETIYTE